MKIYITEKEMNLRRIVPKYTTELENIHMGSDDQIKSLFQEIGKLDPIHIHAIFCDYMQMGLCLHYKYRNVNFFSIVPERSSVFFSVIKTHHGEIEISEVGLNFQKTKEINLQNLKQAIPLIQAHIINVFDVIDEKLGER